MKNDSGLRGAIDGWFEDHSDALVRDLGRLVAVKSVQGGAAPGKPYGEGPAAALELAGRILEEKGFTTSNFENRVVTADLKGAPALGILAHLDTVSVGEGWDSEPFALDMRDGFLYGRGVIDNKGPAVATIYALAAARDLMPELTKGCRLILGTAEETGHDDLVHYSKAHRMPPAVFTPDANYPVVNLEKGRFVPTFGASWEESRLLPRVVSVRGGETANVVPNHAEAYVEGLPLAYIQALCVQFSAKKGASVYGASFHDGVRLIASGTAAHAMKPAEGVNAQTALLSVLSELPLRESPCASAIKYLAKLFPHGDTSGEALGVAMKDEISGPLTLNFGVLSLGPAGFTADFDCRSPKCANEENLDGVALRALKDAGFTVSDVKRTACHHTPAESGFVQTLLRVYEEYTGLKGACIALGGQTYVHDIDGGVAFGPAFPGVDNRLHGANEFISVKDLILSAKMYTRIIIDMCS
jgi:succinyl-diaminopimelate desuccinylase